MEQLADDALRDWPADSQPLIRLGVRDLLIKCATAAKEQARRDAFLDAVVEISDCACVWDAMQLLSAKGQEERAR